MVVKSPCVFTIEVAERAPADLVLPSPPGAFDGPERQPAKKSLAEKILELVRFQIELRILFAQRRLVQPPFLGELLELLRASDELHAVGARPLLLGVGVGVHRVL